MPEVDDLVDYDGLREFLADELGETETFDVERHEQGFSNETLFVTWDDRELVVRRPPPGETADTAHDVLREYAPIDALQETDVPVPETIAACEDTSVLGSVFYVMERVEGDVLRFSAPGRFNDPDHQRRIGEEMIDTLAAIHTVDYEAVGLGDFGDPEGFAERQVERWTKQIEWAFEETTAEREVPKLERVGDWLAETVPANSPAALVHGDYKLDNVVFGPGTPPEITGVLDWEMSTLGDPLCDLGWLLFFWPEEKDPLPPIMQTIAPPFLTVGEYPTRATLTERYEDKTGFAVDNHRFYRVLAVYKMAALGEMFYARYLMGNSDNRFYEMMDDGVPAMAEQAIDIIEGDQPL